MLDLRNQSISGMHWEGDILYLALPDEHLVVTYEVGSEEVRKVVEYPHEVWDICFDKEGLWMMTGGGRMGLQVAFWSFQEGKETQSFNCPDGAGAGITLYEGNLWMTHRHNRKLFCLDPESGKVKWVIKTENEAFSPSACGNEFWLIESTPGPLGHWSSADQARFFFARYDPARELVMRRLTVPFIPRCMAFDSERFWYSEYQAKGFASAEKNLGQL